ncbi:MAG: HAD family hydrolase [Gammaproteobacteria bacterium]|nr:HAD family hydrolase [Gammaproteobacteria bacterium]MDH5651930.1 HAD family hydrolase [Gammaproteobacteria bacterium]
MQWLPAMFHQPHSLQAVCFDLFNTLISVGRVPETVGCFTADILGVTRQQWNEACFGPLHEICRPADHLETLQCLAHSIDPAIPFQCIRKAAQARQQRFDYALRKVPSVVLNGLAQIRGKGFKLALISNASSSEVEAWPESPLAGLFDEVIFSWSAGLKKPDQQIYAMAAQRLGVDSSRCLFVGDGGSDEHFGAHAAGMQPVLITHYMDEQECREKQQKYRDVLVGVAVDIDEIDEKWCSTVAE